MSPVDSNYQSDAISNFPFPFPSSSTHQVVALYGPLSELTAHASVGLLFPEVFASPNVFDVEAVLCFPTYRRAPFCCRSRNRDAPFSALLYYSQAVLRSVRNVSPDLASTNACFISQFLFELQIDMKC
ncbi:hypothetical protein NPIL_54591 [Nephila pilipes]|uniref:Uncharacterized protein n=1 Tax=Nephila pilipes TaxID=299642 RepID=A0A8X6R0C9_NEPPI|nr:hypothetical protein NPIL_54591 [Nephila pilipes]